MLNRQVASIDTDNTASCVTLHLGDYRMGHDMRCIMQEQDLRTTVALDEQSKYC